ncbi:hypothetical protein ASPACDRAFT_48107 [Aspergillus aculeatus ATCC 16872]|uniref:Uncharacterized protein n=1 Tax=Aspergillus aculeatus (strain ATCC 16872 / CBS 172.66 / WB 5094) TaxID=690307 RepID=A0A1L9WGQ8_ASPA1|nr:uncharacterized protein ASPACDRAFT_48107 [Aspergillus aculeatus ATCC 16872]OJJ95358.1 hypothetical protein ASPACDRAFT_48107 [Aspergillus aculeatus ATCC 16872]
MSGAASHEPGGFPELEEETLRHLEGKSYVVGTNEYRLTRLVGESMNIYHRLRRAVFWATRISDGFEVVVKFFIECGFHKPPYFLQHPILATVDPHRGIFNRLRSTVIEGEFQALDAAEDVKGLPHILDRSRSSGEVVQGPEFEYPGGRLDIVAMTRLPGYPLNFFEGQLQLWEVDHVKGEVLRIVRELRQRGQAYVDGDPDKVIFDRRSLQSGYLLSRTRTSHLSSRVPY